MNKNNLIDDLKQPNEQTELELAIYKMRWYTPPKFCAVIEKELGRLQAELTGEITHRKIWYKTACDEAKKNDELRAERDELRVELAAIKRQFKYAVKSWKKEEIMVQDEMAQLRAELAATKPD